MNNSQALTLDSREVAKMLPKRHDHLMRDISTYMQYLNAPKIGAVDFFQESTYKDSKGEVRKCYLITKKGCEFIAHKMTGKKGALFTATYINRFHEMEAALKKPMPVPQTTQLKRLTWHGSFVMTSTQLQELTGVNRSVLKARADSEGLRYFFLVTEEVKAFIEQNHLPKCIYRIIVYPQETVLHLLKLTGLYKTLKPRFDEYFLLNDWAALPVEHNVSCDSPAIRASVEFLSEKSLTMNGILKQLPDYKRKPSEHEAVINLAQEIGVSIFSELCKLKEKVHSLK
ncbi:Rha family transcriptional regulator [Acidaminococcus sp.]|uniref:Rha family transcriptional regulator n=1 Tax=Acidaminococcus sp. TaxID=1872103 RepID=UPI003D7C7B9D